MGFSTDAIHAGQKPDPTTGAVITPLYLTSTYAQEEIGKHKGYEYGRTHNLTRSAYENNLAALEKGKYGIAFSSGLAATNALMGLLNPGDHIIATENVYGGTYRLFELILKNFGLEFSWIDTNDLALLQTSLKSNTKMIFIETPTNPMLQLTDLELAADFAQKNKLISVVDNTFMSPYFQNPLSLGIDIVIHSATKYINGHSDVIGGIIVTNNDEYHERLRYLHNAAGAVPSPFDCWLTLRATKTLAVRMERHEKNALAIAEHLLKIPSIRKVFYPGLPQHHQYELAKKQMRGFGGMVTVDLGSFNEANNFVKKLKIFTLAESLGGVESLVCHPVSMTHGSIPKEKRDKIGLSEGIVRLSVGIEDIEDLIEDINQALV